LVAVPKVVLIFTRAPFAWGAPDLENKMKKVALAAALSLATTSAFAGGAVEPMMEPEVVAKETSSSSQGILIPLFMLVLIAAAISAHSSTPVT
jgi:hypothetical protein